VDTLTDSFDVDFGVDEWHGHNVFSRDGDRCVRTYSLIPARRGDGTTWSYLDHSLGPRNVGGSPKVTLSLSPTSGGNGRRRTGPRPRPTQSGSRW